ncbi:MAG TPA: LamG domain-containing protein, partial [Archangium sp.]|nr:LamG domain-containing protein [Archangium sp.]
DRYPSAADALLALDAPLPRPASRWPLVAAGAALVVGAVAFVSSGREPAPAPAVVAVPPEPPTPQEPPKAPEPPAQESPPPVTPAVKELAHWSFEDSSREPLFKSAGGGPALRHSEVDQVLGVRGQAALLGGKGSLVVKSAENGGPGLRIPSEGALSLWLSPERPGAGPVLTTYAGMQRVLQLRLDESGRLYFGWGPRGLTSPQPLELGRFVHVAVEWGATGMRLWVDGERVAEDAVPVPDGESGEGLRIGWDSLAPGELAPAMALDEVRLRSGPQPSETWALEARDLVGPGRGSAPSVKLRMEESGDISLSEAKSSGMGPDACLRDARLHLDGMEFFTDEQVHLSATFSFHSRTRCSVSLPLFLGDEGEHGRTEYLYLRMERGGVEHVRKDFTLPKGGQYGFLEVGGSRAVPLVKFRIDWETRTVQRVRDNTPRE